MRVLYISYFYPPLGGPAVLRNVKTVKYLAENDISCDVITVRDIEYLYRDKSLLAECREDKLIRTDSWDPMALLKKSQTATAKGSSRLYLNTPEKIKLLVRRMYPIDNKIGWVPHLVKAGRKALAEKDYDLIYVSLGPFSSALGAYKLSKESGIPLAIDLRDYWNLLSDYELQGSILHRKFSRHWEKKVYRHAKLIVTATRGIGEDAASAYGSDLAAKMITIYNGWDEADFADLPAPPKSTGYTLAYFGNIYARRSFQHLYRAVRRLKEENALPENTRVRLYGNFFKETLDEIAGSGIAGMIETIPQLTHRGALREMLASDALLLAINSSSPRGTLTSKIFEYLRAQKPILAMVPAQNEAAALLRKCGQENLCAMESAESIYQCLKYLINTGHKDYSIPWELERKNQVGILAEKLKSLG